MFIENNTNIRNNSIITNNVVDNDIDTTQLQFSIKTMCGPFCTTFASEVKKDCDLAKVIDETMLLFFEFTENLEEFAQQSGITIQKISEEKKKNEQLLINSTLTKEEKLKFFQKAKGFLGSISTFSGLAAVAATGVSPISIILASALIIRSISGRDEALNGKLKNIVTEFFKKTFGLSENSANLLKAAIGLISIFPPSYLKSLIKNINFKDIEEVSKKISLYFPKESTEKIKLYLSSVDDFIYATHENKERKINIHLKLLNRSLKETFSSSSKTVENISKSSDNVANILITFSGLANKILRGIK